MRVHACVCVCVWEGGGARARIIGQLVTESSNRVCTSETMQGCKFKPQSWQAMA